MKIIDITILKEEMEDGIAGLCCRATLDDGAQIGAGYPWRNPLGLWASDNEARESAEIVAALRVFAKAIERAAEDKAKAA